MTSDQLNQLFNLLLVALPVLWRVFFSTRKNTPKQTEIRLTNGHANGESKLSTDDWRIYRERELIADKLLVETATDLTRWRSFVDQRYFELQMQLSAHQRATEESIRHLEEFNRLMAVRIQQLDDCCSEGKKNTQETVKVKPVPVLPDIQPSEPGTAGLESVA